jgi:hypothetical protein
VLAVEDVSAPETADTLAALGTLGPTALILIPLAFALLVVLGFVAAGTIAVTGVRRLGMPGLAWTLGGVRLELHGLRADLRVWQRDETLPELEPLDEHRALFPPRRSARTEAPPAPAAHEPAPVSRRGAPAPRNTRRG